MLEHATDIVQPDQRCHTERDQRRAKIFVAERRYRIEHADKVGNDIRPFEAVWDKRASVLPPELSRDGVADFHQELPMAANVLAAVGRAELIDVLDPMLCKLVDALWIATQLRAIGQTPRNAAIRRHTRDRADGVGAAVEPIRKIRSLMIAA